MNQPPPALPGPLFPQRQTRIPLRGGVAPPSPFPARATGGAVPRPGPWELTAPAARGSQGKQATQSQARAVAPYAWLSIKWFLRNFFRLLKLFFLLWVVSSVIDLYNFLIAPVIHFFEWLGRMFSF